MIEIDHFGKVTQLKMYRIFCGRPAHLTACYYVDGLLIDTGNPVVADEIEAAFDSLPVHTIVNTHHHEDHIGNNIVFQNKQMVGPALAHRIAVPYITNPETWAAKMRFYRQFANGAPPPSDAREIGPEVSTDGYNFQVIHTPGHTDGHISLFEPTRGWLFTGDLFVSEQIQTMHCEEDVYKMIDSLNRLLQYDFKTLFCASGRVVDNARDAVRAKSLYLEDLGESVRELDRRGMEPEEIREQLLGEEGFLHKVSEGEWGKINLVRSYLRRANQIAPLAST